MAFFVGVLGDVEPSVDQDLSTLFDLITRLGQFAKDPDREEGLLVLGPAVQSLRGPGLLATLKDSQRGKARFGNEYAETSRSQAVGRFGRRLEPAICHSLVPYLKEEPRVAPLTSISAF